MLSIFGGEKIIPSQVKVGYSEYTNPNESACRALYISTSDKCFFSPSVAPPCYPERLHKIDDLYIRNLIYINIYVCFYESPVLNEGL